MTSLILDTVVRAAFPTVLVFSVYLLFVGHNAPGGGFVGGLTAGAALVLQYVAGGSDRLREVSSLRAEWLLGVGLAVAGATGAAAWLFGGEFLESGIAELRLPLLGEIKLVSTLFFDLGVYLVVVGLILGILTSLGLDEEEP